MLQRISTFAVGLTCGAVVGAAISLILTPASGKSLRQGSKQHVQNVLLESSQAADDIRQGLREEWVAKTQLPAKS